MQLRPLLLALTLFAPALAGCIGGGDDDGSIDSATTEQGGANTSSPTGRGSIVAFEETNKTEEGAGGVDHHHDYWEGRDRVVIFEQNEKMHPMAARNTASYEAVATFRPVPGAMIYEATERVEFTITNPERHVCEGEDTFDGDYICTDNFFGLPNAPDPAGGPAGLTLRYKHASTATWVDVGDIAWDTPVVIKITNPVQTDMPHATSSLWEFQVASPNKHDTTLTFTAKAEIVRGADDIPLWPGHPDFYAEGPHRVVLRGSGLVAGDPGLYGHGAALVPAEAGPVAPERLISYGTRTLYVWLNITDVQAANPATAPNNWFLFHANSSGVDNITDAFDTEGHAFDKREFSWTLPVNDAGMDSPYSDESRWRFMLGGSLTTTLVACYADCANWAATYDLVIHASSEALPFDAYDWNCLRDEECPEPPAA